MNHWNLSTIELEARKPQILATTDDARAIVLALAAGSELADHQVHERAWVTVITGQVELTLSATGERTEAGAGTLFAFEPGERHAVEATTDARLLLLLTPWPGVGHPGATPPEEKERAHEVAEQRRATGPT